MVRMGCFAFSFVVNLDDNGKPSRLGEPEFDEPAQGNVRVCLPMFTFRFHVQLAAKPH